MRIIDGAEIEKFLPEPAECVQFVQRVLEIKHECVLPPKVSLHFSEHNFFNTMPCMMPKIDRMAVKAVSRVVGRHPSVQGDMLVYEMSSGRLLAVLDATVITEWRTGAVAAHSLNLFGRPQGILSMIGLGATARTTLKCFLSAYPNNRPRRIKLLRYKDQAERFATEFEGFGVCFEIVETIESLIRNADTIVSCVTAFDCPVAKDDWFQTGCLVIPVHTRGFQNCDLFFDKVFADDRGHVCHFSNFSKFQFFAEVADVVMNKCPGRESSDERILVYNIGIGLHDLYLANEIIKRSSLESKE